MRNSKTDVSITGYLPGLLGRVVELHGTYYSRHWKLDGRFEAEVARDIGDFMRRYEPARDCIWAASHSGRVLGSITIDGSGSGEDGAARLRWFILEESSQGLGLGRRLMDAAMSFSRSAGHERVFLWTMAGLAAARHLYDAYGFEVTDSFEDTDWGDTVLHQRMDKVL